MGIAAVVRLSRSGPSTPPVSEQQARAEANDIVTHLARLDGYPFDARYSEGARDQAVRLAGLTKDAYEYFAVVFPGARPQAGRVQRPEDYYKERGTLDGWSAAMHAADLWPELGAEVSSTLARAIADWPRIHGASDP